MTTPLGHVTCACTVASANLNSLVHVAVPDKNRILFCRSFRASLTRYSAARGGTHTRFVDTSDIHTFT